MPYKDPEKRKLAGNERSRRYRKRLHDATFGPDAGDMKGRHGNHAKGADSGKWSGERRLTSHGYIAVRVPVDHPHGWGSRRLKRFKYAYEHVLVMIGSIGRQLVSNELVHHRNGDKTDNRIENLELMTLAEHQRLHAEETRSRDQLGRFA